MSRFRAMNQNNIPHSNGYTTKMRAHRVSTKPAQAGLYYTLPSPPPPRKSKSPLPPPSDTNENSTHGAQGRAGRKSRRHALQPHPSKRSRTWKIGRQNQNKRYRTTCRQRENLAVNLSPAGGNRVKHRISSSICGSQGTRNKRHHHRPLPQSLPYTTKKTT